MDLSPLIFVALAVAWAVYLVPQALRHHDEVARSRSVDRFSHTMRVLARREPVDPRNARLVVSPGRTPSERLVETKPRTSAAPPVDPVAARRASARRAVRRRRRVLGLVLLANAVVVGLAVAKVVAWPWVAVPAATLVAWLVACRLMVIGEQRVRRPRSAIEIGFPPDLEETGELRPVPAPRRAAEPVVDPVAEPAVLTGDSVVAEAPAVLSGEIPVVDAGAPGMWDMVSAPLPTYVTKPAAVRRTVQTIDLDSTGVWSSGRSDSDSALAREAEEAERTARTEQDDRRASGA